MASIFDYLYTCSSCEKQYVSEGRGEVYYEDTPTLEWTLKKGQLKMNLKSYGSRKSIDTDPVCRYCLDYSYMTNDDVVKSPWVQHYLQEQLPEIISEGYRLEAPFDAYLSPEECLEVAKDLLMAETQKKIQDETNKVKELLKGLVANPNCDVTKLEKEVLKIFGKAAKSSSSKSSSSKATASKSVSTDSSAENLFALYTKAKLIGWLKSVGDTEHRKSWKKDALINALLRYPVADVLSSFTLTDLKQGMEELGLSTKGKKKALIDRLVTTL